MSILHKIVLDTNVVLDCFLFEDISTSLLQKKLCNHELIWLATPSMELEYLRVLTYPNVQRWLTCKRENEQCDLESIFQRYANIVQEPGTSLTSPKCRDPDDQIFIDLAITHQVLLLSKDYNVLKLNRQKGLSVHHPKELSVTIFLAG